VFVFLYYCGVLFCFLTNVDVRLLHLNKPASQSVSHIEFELRQCDIVDPAVKINKN